MSEDSKQSSSSVGVGGGFVVGGGIPGSKKEVKPCKRTLQIRIMASNGMPPKDIKTSDPYCKYWFATPAKDEDGNDIMQKLVDKQSGRTETKSSTLVPEWNHDLEEFEVSNEDTLVLCMELWDHDSLSKDDFIGYAEFPVEFKGTREHHVDVYESVDKEKVVEYKHEMCVVTLSCTYSKDVCGECPDSEAAKEREQLRKSMKGVTKQMKLAGVSGTKSIKSSTVDQTDEKSA